MGAAVGFGVSEAVKYMQQRNAEEKYMRDKLGLSKGDVRALKKYGFGKINLQDFNDTDGKLWSELKAGHTELKGYLETLRTKDYDPKDGVIKAGKMHIRRDTDIMVKNGAYGFDPLNYGNDVYGTRINVHYDKFDVILFPLTHFVFDSIYQWILGVK